MTALASSPPAVTPSLRSRAIRGSAWTIGAYAAASVIRLASNFVLAQLFAPDIFGLLAIALLIQQGLAMFSDLGIGLSIVRHRDGTDPAFLNTAWTIQVIRGVLIWLVACALTWPAAAFYDRPALMAVIPVLSLTAILQGLTSTRLATARRDIDLARVSWFGIGEAALRFVTIVGGALVFPSVWAIVAGNLFSSAVYMLASHMLLPGSPNRPAWDRSAARELLGFGTWVFVSTGLTFFVLQSDKLMLGKLADPVIFGVYAVSIPFAKLPHDLGAVLVGAVLFPALASKARESPESLCQALERSRSVTLPAGLAATLGVALVSPWFFSLYKPSYGAATWMAPTLAAGFWFGTLQACSDRAIPVLGSARPLATANVAALVVTVATCWIGFATFGIQGFVLGVGAGSLAGYLVIAGALAARGLGVFMRDLKYTAVLGACLALAFGVPRLGLGLTPWGVQVLSASISLAILGAVGAFALSRAWRFVARREAA